MNGPGYNPYRPERDRLAGKNTLANNALIFGIGSLIVNFFGLVGAVAIVWGIFAIRRANAWQRQGYQPVGRTRAIWGIVLGSVGIVLTVGLKGFVF